MIENQVSGQAVLKQISGRNVLELKICMALKYSHVLEHDPKYSMGLDGLVSENPHLVISYVHFKLQGSLCCQPKQCIVIREDLYCLIPPKVGPI